MKASYARMIDFESIPNFRDLGGYRNRDGMMVAWRRIFRSGDLRNINARDLLKIQKEIGLATVIDLRTAEEAEIQGKWHCTQYGIQHYHIPFPGGGGNKKEDRRLLQASTNLGKLYLHIIGAKTFKKQLTRALEIIASPQNHPVVFHCAIGKDRTGILSAILLSILGVEDTVIIEDYTLSGPPVSKVRQEMMKNPPELEFIKQLPDYFWQADPASMDIFLSDIKKKHGSMLGFLIDLGIDTYLINSIRKNLLVWE